MNPATLGVDMNDLMITVDHDKFNWVEKYSPETLSAHELSPMTQVAMGFAHD